MDAGDLQIITLDENLLRIISTFVSNCNYFVWNFQDYHTGQGSVSLVEHFSLTHKTQCKLISFTAMLSTFPTGFLFSIHTQNQQGVSVARRISFLINKCLRVLSGFLIFFKCIPK